MAQAITAARVADAATTAAFQETHQFWQTNVALAPLVLRRDLEGCRRALLHAAAFEDIEEFASTVILERVSESIATLSCTIRDDEIIPTEEVKVTAAGKLSVKEMAIGKYWALFQDHVCSSALRIAREVFAVVGTERVVVNMRIVRNDPSTGHRGPVTVLGANFSRTDVGRLNLSAIDPSDAMKNFPHRMKFKKTMGFDAVEPMTDDEQWVST